MDLPIISRVYFDRKPPYAEEAALRAAGEQVRVHYELEVERAKASQKVNQTEEKKQVDNNVDNKERNMLTQEQILQKVIELNKMYPDFQQKSQSDKMQIIADLINGKHDDLIFKEETNERTPGQPDSQLTDTKSIYKAPDRQDQQIQGSRFSATA